MPRFRHLDYSRAAPIGSMGPAAIDDLLDRGDFETWRPLARAVAQDPWGSVATSVLQMCEAHPMYGTSSLWRRWIERRRGLNKEVPASTLADLRAQAGLTQVQIAQRLGISQADVSKLERRTDVRVSTLRAYARAIGAELHITVKLPGNAESMEIALQDEAGP